MFQYQKSTSVLLKAESEVNGDKNNAELKQHIAEKGKAKEKEKAKKAKDMEFKWSKRPTSNQKLPSDLEAEVTHCFPEHHTPFDVFSSKTNLDALVKT